MPSTNALNVGNMNHLERDLEETGSFSCECFDLKVAFGLGIFNGTQENAQNDP